MFTLITILSVLYFILILILIIGFNKIPLFKTENVSEKEKFTIIIPFRNEAENILELTKSLQNLLYNSAYFEVIFVDDASIDASVNILKKEMQNHSNWRCISNKRKSNSPKKDAINTAINLAKHHWIITTDADCQVPKKWLQSLNAFINKNPNVKFIASPVLYKTNGSFLQEFQKIDFLSLIGATIGGFGIQKPFLCNGANLCYKKERFFELNGFKGNDSIASGDDIFLMEKFKRAFKKDVQFLKSTQAIVRTKPVQTITELYNQRIRWASKTAKTKDSFGKIVGILVFLMNVIWLYAFWYLILGFPNKQFIFILLLKYGIDYILIYKTNKFLDAKSNLSAYFLASFLYPFFVISVVFLSVFKKYEWKNRMFSK